MRNVLLTESYPLILTNVFLLLKSTAFNLQSKKVGSERRAPFVCVKRFTNAPSVNDCSYLTLGA